MSSVTARNLQSEFVVRVCRSESSPVLFQRGNWFMELRRAQTILKRDKVDTSHNTSKITRYQIENILLNFTGTIVWKYSKIPWIICSGTILLHLRHSFSHISRVGDWLKLQFPLFFVIPIVFNCARAPNPAVTKALINGCQSCGRRSPAVSTQLSLPGPSANKCVRPCITRNKQFRFCVC